MLNSPPIIVQQLSVRYGNRRVLDDVTLSVPHGSTFGFIGPNGAGKSSLIKTILGLLFPASGTVLLQGLTPDVPAARLKVGYLPEEATYPKFLTAREILRFYGRVSGLGGSALESRIQELLKRVDLESAADRRLGTFSKGMAQKVGLMQALIHDPDLLILDEPTSGLDPVAKLRLREVMQELKAKGKTLFFSSHELSEVELICDYAAILVSGKIVKSGELHEIVGPGHPSLEKLFVQYVSGAGK